MWKTGKKRFLCFCTTVFLAVGIFGCGINLTEDGEGTGKKGKENAALAKEHVYRFQEIEMPELSGDEYEICGVACVEGDISLAVRIMDWEDYNDNDIRVISVKSGSFEAREAALETVHWDTGFYYDNITFGAKGLVYGIRNGEERKFPWNTPPLKTKRFWRL